MRKLSLKLDDLSVESFAVGGPGEPRGTVRGNLPIQSWDAPCPHTFPCIDSETCTCTANFRCQNGSWVTCGDTCYQTCGSTCPDTCAQTCSSCIYSCVPLPQQCA